MLHFFDENRRVEAQAAALKDGRFEDFLSLVSESGDSSWRLLQNCSSPSDPSEQGIPLALTLTRRFLRERGACRVHGGGFAGTIQAYVPKEQLGEYRELMEGIFGPGAVVPLRLRRPADRVLRLEP